MKILFISPNSPFESIGGVERYLLNLIEYYKDKKLETYVLLPSKEENHSEKRGNVTIYYNNSLYLSKNSTPKDVSAHALLFSEFVQELIKEEKIEIICAENFHLGLPAAYSLLLNMISMQNKIPLVLKVHSFASSNLQIELINQLTWNQISCVSKSVSGDCFHKGADINQISTDYLGVDTKKFKKIDEEKNKLKKELGLEKDSKIILSASRIILGRKNILGEKGIITLLEAFSKLSNRFPKLHLLIAVGKPPEILKNEFDNAFEMLLGYIKLHNIEDKTIVKLFKLEEMPMVYNGSDLFVLASENETFGQVFIESMACGLPVIGTNVGGIPEIISDSYNGYLVPPYDSSILAQKIEKLIVDTSLRNKFIKAGIKTVNSNFTSEKQFSNFDNALKLLRK
jgi:glycosyltransferase involved in cell wall biosynthesis